MEPVEDLADVPVRTVPRQMLPDLLGDQDGRLPVLRARVRPRAARMQGVLGGALVAPPVGAVAMHSKAEADLRLRVPDRPEHVDEVILGRLLKTRLDYEESAVEVLDIQGRRRLLDALRVVLQSAGSLTPCATASFAKRFRGSALPTYMGWSAPDNGR